MPIKMLYQFLLLFLSFWAIPSNARKFQCASYVIELPDGISIDSFQLVSSTEAPQDAMTVQKIPFHLASKLNVLAPLLREVKKAKDENNVKRVYQKMGELSSVLETIYRTKYFHEVLMASVLSKSDENFLREYKRNYRAYEKILDNMPWDYGSSLLFSFEMPGLNL